MKLALRSLSGAIYAGLILFCCWLGATSVAILLVVFGILAQREALALLKHQGLSAWAAVGLGLVAPWVGMMLPGWVGLVYLAALIPFVFAKTTPKPAYLLGLSLGYIPLAFHFGIGMSQIPEGNWYVLLLFITLWGADSFAYLTGNLIGKTPLLKRVSPNKSIEGLLGGWILTALTLYWITPALGLDQTTGLFFGLAIPPISALGDLFESRLKRLAEVKDSGNLIPGHGGILDRLDSFLFAAPLAYFYLLNYSA